MKLWRVVKAALREIFEEAAFERYCEREGISPCRDSYARFVRERGAPKVKCC